MTDTDAQTKESVTATLPYRPDEFYTAKYYQGEVVPGWSYADYLAWKWEYVTPFGTRNCHSVAHP